MKDKWGDRGPESLSEPRKLFLGSLSAAGGNLEGGRPGKSGKEWGHNSQLLWAAETSLVLLFSICELLISIWRTCRQNTHRAFRAVLSLLGRTGAGSLIALTSAWLQESSYLLDPKKGLNPLAIPAKAQSHSIYKTSHVLSYFYLWPNILGWPQSSFGCFHNILRKPWTNILANSIESIIIWERKKLLS